MRIQIGVTQKMKLYNVYRLCKQNINFLESAAAKKDNKSGLFVVSNWDVVQERFKLIKKIPSFKNYINDCINSVPVLVRESVSPQIDSSTAQKINSKLKVITNRMKVIIELYESMEIGDDGNGIDIKIPPCDDLKEYISYLRDIEFIFSQCPFLQCENETLKFESVDVGSNWIRLAVASTSTCILLTNIGAVVDKAITLRSHYITVQQQEEMLKATQMKNELAKDQINFFNSIRDAYMSTAIKELQEQCGELKDGEKKVKQKDH